MLIDVLVECCDRSPFDGTGCFALVGVGGGHGQHGSDKGMPQIPSLFAACLSHGGVQSIVKLWAIVERQVVPRSQEDWVV